MAVSGIHGALTNAVQGMNRAGQETARIAQSVAENGIDGLDRNLVDLTLQKVAFKANVAVARTADEMSDALLDIIV